MYSNKIIHRGIQTVNLLIKHTENRRKNLILKLNAKNNIVYTTVGIPVIITPDVLIRLNEY